MKLPLFHLSHEEPLTKILDRRGVETRAKEELAKIKRLGGDLAIIVIDLDYFKAINDHFGLHIGDCVLREFSRLIKLNLQSYDIYGRIGEEEFVVLMPGTTKSQFLVIAERLRKLGEIFSFDRISKDPQISASFGLANYHSGVDTLKKLIKCADAALYHPKSQGRNQVTHYSELANQQIVGARSFPQ